MVIEKKAKEAQEKAAKAEEADLLKKDAFAELQKLAAQPAPRSGSPSSNGASAKVNPTFGCLKFPEEIG